MRHDVLGAYNRTYFAALQRAEFYLPRQTLALKQKSTLEMSAEVDEGAKVHVLVLVYFGSSTSAPYATFIWLSTTAVYSGYS